MAQQIAHGGAEAAITASVGRQLLGEAFSAHYKVNNTFIDGLEEDDDDDAPAMMAVHSCPIARFQAPFKRQSWVAAQPIPEGAQQDELAVPSAATPTYLSPNVVVSPCVSPCTSPTMVTAPRQYIQAPAPPQRIQAAPMVFSDQVLQLQQPAPAYISYPAGQPVQMPMMPMQPVQMLQQPQQFINGARMVQPMAYVPSVGWPTVSVYMPASPTTSPTNGVAQAVAQAQPEQQQQPALASCVTPLESRQPEPSMGSKDHDGTGKCRPCAWFWKLQGCENGKDCRHCHMCPEGELKSRRKNKTANLRGRNDTGEEVEGG